MNVSIYETEKLMKNATRRAVAATLSKSEMNKVVMSAMHIARSNARILEV
jgi:hypothetical protein